jgi:hypothetical protein
LCDVYIYIIINFNSLLIAKGVPSVVAVIVVASRVRQCFNPGGRCVFMEKKMADASDNLVGLWLHCCYRATSAPLGTNNEAGPWCR